MYGPMNAELHALAHGKALWLSHDFMFGRLGVGLLVLMLAGWRLIRADLVPDLLATRDAAGQGRRALYDRWSRDYDGSDLAAARQYGRIRHFAPVYVVAYAIVLTLVAFDGIMALQPHWFSNLFGGFFFMGSYLGAHMLLALMTIYGASHLGVADLVSPKQRHDLGKLCFGFTVFWTYLMWAQFLVIWYGNMPEETGSSSRGCGGAGAGRMGRGSRDVHRAVLRPAGRCAEEGSRHARLLRRSASRRSGSSVTSW